MSLLPVTRGGYYDEQGNWQRTKYCFTRCQRCDCTPPGGLFYSAAHDTRKNGCLCKEFAHPQCPVHR